MRTRTVIPMVLAALGLAACESTQDKAERAREEGGGVLAERRGLEVEKVSRDIELTDTQIVRDDTGVAAVVEVRNRGPAAVGVPVALRLLDAKGKEVFANDQPGIEPALAGIALLPRGERTFWVHNQIVVAQAPKRAVARVGEPRSVEVPAQIPDIDISKVELDRDADGAIARGVVVNRSKVVQKRLTISAIARRGGRIVAAGRSVVEKLPPAPTKKPTRFSVYFIGDPTGAELEITVPPVDLR